MSEWKEISIDQIKADSKSSIAVGPFGSKLKSEEYIESGIPVIRGTNISSSKEFSGEFVFISEEKAKTLGSANVYPGDIVFPHRGAIGEVGIVNDQGNKHYVISSSLMKLSPNKDKAHSEFLYYFFKSNKGKYELLKNASTVGTPGIGQPLASLKSINLKLPPLSEQKAIAHILGTLDEKIELNRKMNQTLEAMAQGLFKSWFVDFDPVIDNAILAGNEIPEELQARVEKRRRVIAGDVIANPDEGGMKQSPSALKPLLHTNPSLAAQFPASFVFNETLGKWIPEGWEVKSFGELIETTIGGDWGKEVPDEKHTEEVKIIRGTDIPSLGNCDLESAPTRFVELKKLKTRKLEVGDIVIEVSGGSPTQSTGRSIRITQNILERLGGVAEPASFCRRLKPINQKFSVLCGEHLTYIYGIGKMWEYQNQSTGISNFQTPYFLDSEMVLVPSDENVLDSFYSQVSIFKNKSTSNENIILTQLRDRLLPELISGRVRVKEGILDS